MTSARFRQVGLVAVLTVAFASLAPHAAFAQEAAGAAARNGSTLHYFGAAIALGMIVIGAALGIGRFAAAAAEGIARQPAAATQITGAINLPLFLLEGVAILAEVFALLVILMK